MTVTVNHVDTDVATRHWLHDPERTWSETNCYSDIWVQLLHRLGLDPVPALAFALETRLEGEQWTFAKPSSEDLYRLYGIRVVELYVWRPLLDHVAEAADRGDLLTIEVDAHWLPDTAATTYHKGHEKTTIVPVELDRARSRLRYLHNAGCYDVDGLDFAHLFASDPVEPGLPLPPYTELIALNGITREPVRHDVLRDVVATHLGRRPDENPVAALGRKVFDDLDWLADAGVETFHLYAFATARQCGAVATMSAAVAGCLDAVDGGLAGAAADFGAVAEGAKTVQFQLARIARGRSADLRPAFDDMAAAWGRAIDLLVARYGG